MRDPQASQIFDSISTATVPNGRGDALTPRSSPAPPKLLPKPNQTIGLRCMEDLSGDVKLVPLSRVTKLDALRGAARELFYRTRSINHVKVFFDGQVLTELYFNELIRPGRIYTVSFVPAMCIQFTPHFAHAKEHIRTIKVPYCTSVWEIRGRIHTKISESSAAPPAEHLILLSKVDRDWDGSRIVLEDGLSLEHYVDFSDQVYLISTFWSNMPAMPEKPLGKEQWFAANPVGVEDVGDAVARRVASPQL